MRIFNHPPKGGQVTRINEGFDVIGKLEGLAAQTSV